MKKLAALALVVAALTGCNAKAQPSATPQSPRYTWRGIHLDVARHFFDVATLKKLVDLEAHFNLNVLHIHFTDDAAWRLPSRRYPKLTSTQHYMIAELRELVAYARDRGVTIVPEVDVPAHESAAIRAYPGLACGSASELCPATAAKFADDVIAELLPVFPSPWIHVGGDEVETWNKNQRALFITHIAETLRRANRTTVVWDDEADVAPRTTIVMVWHLGNAAKSAIASGHRVVMASDGPLYFNAAQGDPAEEPPATRYVSTLEQVYAFSPPPRGVLGIEATVWTEKVATPQALWYMLLPRALALAEVATLPPEQKNWTRFYRSLPQKLAWLERNGFGYRIPNVMFRLSDPHARFASVPGNINAATVYARVPATVTAESSLENGTTYTRMNGGAWKQRSQIPDVPPGSTIEAYAVSGSRRSATTLLYVKRKNGETTAASRSFDAVVSP